MTIHAAVIDDERIIAADLARQIGQRKGWSVAGAFHHPDELRKCVMSADVDVCFLDIEMPGTDGLELARELREIKSELLFVFVTAHMQYAATAFRIDAVDYLVKPAHASVIDETCRRVEERLSAPAPVLPDKIEVISTKRVDYIPITEILAAKAAGNYVALVTPHGEYLHRTTLTSFLEMVSRAGFIRTHRSHIVQPSRVVAAKTRGGEIHEVVLSTGQVIPVSEAFRKEVALRLKSVVIAR